MVGLSLFSTVLKDRAEKQQKIGLLVSKLLHVHSHILTLQKVAEVFKDNSKNWEEYEPMRHRFTQRHFLKSESHVDSLQEAIDGISGIYPVEARSLHNLIDMLLKGKNTSLSATASTRGRDLYIRMLSMYEVGLIESEKMLRTYILRYARRHGIYTYASVRWELRNRSNSLHKKNIEFVERFSAESWAAIRELQRKSPTPHSTASAEEGGDAV